MMRQHRITIIVLAGMALIALLLLAAGAGDIDLSVPAQPFPFRIRLPRLKLDLSADLQPVDGETAAPGWLRYLLLLVPIAILAILLSPEARKSFVRSVVIALALLLVIRRVSLQLARDGGEGEFAFGAELSLSPPAEFLNNPPAWLVWGVPLLLAALLAGAAFGIGWVIWRQARSRHTLRALAQEAQGALNALQGGEELRNAVLRCYQGMIRVLRRERGIERRSSMTPAEFEAQLAQTGLPLAEITRLTRLFERARYGSQAPGAAEEAEAIASLQAIVEAVGKAS